MRRLLAVAAAVVSTSVAVPAMAQVQVPSGLVNVTIGDVSILNNFLNDTQIAALNNLNVPVTVQVPIGVAANVCDVNANVLAKQAKQGSATCAAKSGSRALAQQVNRQLLTQKR